MQLPPGLFHPKNPEFLGKTKLPAFRRPVSAPVFRLPRHCVAPQPRWALHGGPAAADTLRRGLPLPQLLLTAQAVCCVLPPGRTGSEGRGPGGGRAVLTTGEEVPPSGLHCGSSPHGVVVSAPPPSPQRLPSPAAQPSAHWTATGRSGLVTQEPESAGRKGRPGQAQRRAQGTHRERRLSEPRPEFRPEPLQRVEFPASGGNSQEAL